MQTEQLVINYHMTEKCNYNCNYCYAKWEKPNEIHKSSDDVDFLFSKLASYFLQDNPIKEALNYTSVRINFAGGEPLLLGRRFEAAISSALKYGFDISLITNGHHLSDAFIKRNASLMGMIGISYDSANCHINKDIGRQTRGGSSIDADRLVAVCEKIRKVSPSTKVKINTVVNPFNVQDSLNECIQRIRPDKWKVLKVLPVKAEVEGISDAQFNEYVKHHEPCSEFISVENNDSMTGSYLMIDPNGCFYQNGEMGAGYLHSRSLLEVPVELALQETGFDPIKFAQRY